ncbi:hypothetical protein D1BOALGB6SA_10238 [Olavius sp. associated proteobacterium Delta 1]|nr:hypothetical protein D1BOALGB6SA_10238 [Olavius sp. associated proteobacterium Delta 1]
MSNLVENTGPFLRLKSCFWCQKGVFKNLLPNFPIISPLSV